MEVKILEDRIQNSYLGDKNIASIIKKFIYSKVIQFNEQYGLKEEYSIKYNKKYGEYISIYPNGQIAKKCFYIEGKEEGECKIWWPNAVLKEHIYYRNGEINGEYKYWNHEGVLRIQCTYKYNKLEGEYKEWWPNGNMFKECNYKDDIKNEGEYKDHGLIMEK